MFPLLLQTIISNQMRPRRLRGGHLSEIYAQKTLKNEQIHSVTLYATLIVYCGNCVVKRIQLARGYLACL